MRGLALRGIEAYQVLRKPLLPECCRFWPSCSEYAKQAINKYGLIKGGLKAASRILRCHPFSGKSGYDPLI